MEADDIQLYKQLRNNIKSFNISTEGLAKPDPTVEDEVTKIYVQARVHRKWLVIFYIVYTIVFSFFVFVLLGLQAAARLSISGAGNFEIMPQWTLDILVGGMFGQFIVLLQIITKRVWDFTPFFDHHHYIKGNDSHTLSSSIKTNQSTYDHRDSDFG